MLIRFYYRCKDSKIQKKCEEEEKTWSHWTVFSCMVLKFTYLTEGPWASPALREVRSSTAITWRETRSFKSPLQVRTPRRGGTSRKIPEPSLFRCQLLLDAVEVQVRGPVKANKIHRLWAQVGLKFSIRQCPHFGVDSPDACWEDVWLRLGIQHTFYSSIPEVFPVRSADKNVGHCPSTSNILVSSTGTEGCTG